MITNLKIYDNISDGLAYSLSAILAGLCISIGCIVNLMVGGGIPGAILFTFGLITVVHYKYALYTGTAGFINEWEDLLILIWYVLLGNIGGCYIASEISTYAIPELVDKVQPIIQSRANVNEWQAFIRAIFCGFLMTTAVKFAREEKWLPLLFAVPVFILAGFYHSIADSYYIMASGITYNDTIGPQVFSNYGMCILGNFVGCNLYRIKFK